MKIPIEDLEDRRVYQIRCRNLVVGVWVAERKGFIGIREKFGDCFLFMEYHYDAGPNFGTVHNMEPYEDITIPEGIELVEGFGVCTVCDQPDQWVRENPPHATPGHWEHVERRYNTHEIRPVHRPNRALFDLLEPLDAAERSAWREETGY